jgi:hypothetical protein
MSMIPGLLVGGLAAGGSWMLARPLIANLPNGSRDMAVLAIVIVAGFVGFLAGGAIGRRALGGSTRLRLFTTVALGVAGGCLGFCFVAIVTVGYLSGYGNWPDDTLQKALYALAVPAFGTVGAIVGATVGILAAVVAGTLLRVISPAWRA